MSESKKAEFSSTPLSDEAKMNLLRLKVAEKELAEVWTTYESAGLHPILIKGWAAAQYYPDPSTRHLGDIDLAFPADEYRTAEALQKEHQLYRTDLHSELRHLDLESWNALFERSVAVPCGDVPIRVLAPEDHLRVICVHWLNDGGAYRERLLDIAFLIQTCGDDIDWDLCLAPVTATRRRWIVTAVGLAKRYAETGPWTVPFAGEFEMIPEWVYAAVEKEWASGIRLMPLHAVLNDPVQLFRQIRKRIPPNPLQATIELEREIDGRSRVGIQLKNMFRRIRPSMARVGPALKRLAGIGKREVE